MCVALGLPADAADALVGGQLPRRWPGPAPGGPDGRHWRALITNTTVTAEPLGDEKVEVCAWPGAAAAACPTGIPQRHIRLVCSHRRCHRLVWLRGLVHALPAGLGA
jgi:hypothetical protein